MHHARIFVLLSILIMALLACGESSTASPAPPTATPKSTAEARLQIEAQVNQIAAGKATFSQHLDSNYVPENASIVVTSLLSDFADNNGGRTEAKSDCFDIQHALWTSGLHFSEIEIHFTANLVDQYGHPLVNMVALCNLKKATAAKFAWDNLNGGSAWDDYDQTLFFAPLTNP